MPIRSGFGNAKRLEDLGTISPGPPRDIVKSFGTPSALRAARRASRMRTPVE